MKSKRLVLLGFVLGCQTLGGLIAQAVEVSVAQRIASLKSPDESIRLQAIDQLAVLGAKAAEAVGPLTELLRDGSAKVRAHAADSLGKIGASAKPAVPALVNLLTDTDESVRRQAIESVMQIRPGPQVTIPLCVKLLEDSDPGVRVRILNAIAEAGPLAVPGLIAALNNDKAAYWACVILRDIGPAAKDAVPALRARLRDPRPDVRREVLLALASMDDAASASLPQIAASLSDEHAATAATYALGRIGQIPADADAVVRANAKSDDHMLSTTSLWALARVHPEDKALRREATERLIERLKDQDAFVRVAAARALSALPPAPEITAPIWEKAFQNADEQTVLHAMDALAAMGAPAVPRLIDGLKHEKLRGQIAHILGEIGPPAAPATASLAKLVADKDDRMAQEAILALAKIGPAAKGAVPTLVAVLQQSENPNAHAIVYTLGKIGPGAAEAEPVLSGLLKSPDKNLALVSAWALVQIQPGSVKVAAETIPVLTAGLASELPVVRRGAAEALSVLGPAAKAAIPALQRAAKDEDPSVRTTATKALQSVSGSAEGR